MLNARQLHILLLSLDSRDGFAPLHKWGEPTCHP